MLERLVHKIPQFVALKAQDRSAAERYLRNQRAEAEKALKSIREKPEKSLLRATELMKRPQRLQRGCCGRVVQTDYPIQQQQQRRPQDGGAFSQLPRLDFCFSSCFLGVSSLRRTSPDEIAPFLYFVCFVLVWDAATFISAGRGISASIDLVAGTPRGQQQGGNGRRERPPLLRQDTDPNDPQRLVKKNEWESIMRRIFLDKFF